MAQLVPENHPALHTISEEVTPEEFADGTVDKIIKGLKSAIKTYNVEGYAAVAIAAPQIGVAKRIFMVEDHADREDSLPYIIAINPKIIKVSKKMHEVGEGCLSVKNTYGVVVRHKNVTIEALDENGNKFTRGAGGLLAQIMQHETDHLDGILFKDRAEQTWYKEDKPEKKDE